MSARRYEQAWRYTASAHARARRFYERRRWPAPREVWNEELDMPLTEYRRTLVTRDQTRA